MDWERPYAPERRAILAAGLRSSPWQHLDATPTRVAGTNQQCHGLTNPLYTVSTTVPQTNRLHGLDVLRGGEPRQFWLDQTTERLMRRMDVPLHARKAVVQALPRERLLTEAGVGRIVCVLHPPFPPLHAQIDQRCLRNCRLSHTTRPAIPRGAAADRG